MLGNDPANPVRLSGSVRKWLRCEQVAAGGFPPLQPDSELFGQIAEFGGVTLKTFFTPAEIAGIDESVFRERDRLGYRAKYIGRFAEFFTMHDPDKVDHASRAELVTEFQRIKGVGPYTAAIIAGSVVRDPSALGLDVWNRKFLAQRPFMPTTPKPQSSKPR